MTNAVTNAVSHASPSRPVTTSTRDVTAPNLSSYLLPLSTTPGQLPERPEPSEGFDAYCAWLDAMCAHVRHMAQLAAAAYHREQLALHRERLAALGEA